MAVVDSLALSITDDLETCQQEEVTLEASGGIAYLWSTGDTTSTISILATTDETYSVTATDVSGCIATDTVLVVVNELSDTTQISLNTCDSLSAGIFEYLYADQNGCDSIVFQTNIFLPLPQTPIVPEDIVIQENEPPFQIAVPAIPNATEYSWTIPIGSEILSGAGTNIITIGWNGMTTGGLICVNALNECGSGPVECFEVVVEIIDGVRSLKDITYGIYPNPATTVLNIVSSRNSQSEITVLNVLGREVIKHVTSNRQTQIDVSQLSSGLYWLKITKVTDPATAFEHWYKVEVLNK